MNFFFAKKTQHVIKVDGMHCQACAKRITNALNNVTGVSQVKVDLAQKAVTVTAKDSVTLSELENVITETGYQVIK